jgi:transcriptional regulator with XRE-family HTH domain
MTIGRRADAAVAAARESNRQIATEIREARMNAGLSQRSAARVAGVSASQLGRLERGELRHATIEQVCRAAGAVGLRIWLRAYPDGDPLRDTAHVRLLERFRACLGHGIKWRTEVPVRGATDLRSWDGMAEVERELIGVEAETRIRDGQATWRKVQRKRDDDRTVALVILLVADTRANRRAMALVRESLRGDLPLDSRAILAALRAGRRPVAGGIVML